MQVISNPSNLSQFRIGYTRTDGSRTVRTFARAGDGSLVETTNAPKPVISGIETDGTDARPQEPPTPPAPAVRLSAHDGALTLALETIAYKDYRGTAMSAVDIVKDMREIARNALANQ